MPPRVKHTYHGLRRKNKVCLSRLSTFSNSVLSECSHDTESSIFSTSSRHQQYQQKQANRLEVEKLNAALKQRERRILQDITNFKPTIPANPLISLAKVEDASVSECSDILPSDINNVDDTFPSFKVAEAPSFALSPIIKIIKPSEDGTLRDWDEFYAHESSFTLHSPSSSNQVPGSSDVLDWDNVYHDSERTSPPKASSRENSEASSPPKVPNREMKSRLAGLKKQLAAVPPVSFTVDPEFLHDFEGIWVKRLREPISCPSPGSPDHFIFH